MKVYGVCPLTMYLEKYREGYRVCAVYSAMILSYLISFVCPVH